MQIHSWQAPFKKTGLFLFYGEILIFLKYTVSACVIVVLSSTQNLEIMKKILCFASLLFIASCSQKNTDSLLVDNEKRILEEIKQQPEITAKIVEQIPFKKIICVGSP